MKFATLKNLSSLNVTWEEISSLVPMSFASKKDFQKEVIKPDFEGAFISAYEGVTPSLRINKENPPFKQWGIVADYDSAIDEEEIVKGLNSRSKTGLRPSGYHRTTSGNLRVFWQFEEALLLIPDIHKKFMRELSKTLGIPKLFGGLDPCIEKADEFFAYTGPFVEYSTDTLSAAFLQSIMFTVIGRYNYKGDGDVEVPLDKVFDKVQDKYPGRWMGGIFSDGGRGNCFWDPASVNPTSAIITKTGMVAFGQHKVFFGWGELLGADFIREFKENTIGLPVHSIWFDGKSYWWKNTRNEWRPQTKEDTAAFLRCTYGLKSRPADGEVASEIDMCMNMIRETKTLDGAAPIIYGHDGIIEYDTMRILNTARRQVINPVDITLTGWGDNFPWLAEFLDAFFEPASSRDYFLAWLKRFYESAYSKKLSQGHALFIAGGVGKGKTLLGNVIVGGLMGGGSDAGEYLLSETNFNKELMEVGVWNVDDNTSSANAQTHKRFSEMIKKIVANTRHKYHAKFRDSVIVEWKGRVIVTLNDDPESIRQIPQTDISVLDKIMLFKVANHKIKFPANDKLEKMIREEMPFFSRWLLDWKIPDEIAAENRYGIHPFHHPVLLEDSRSMGASSIFSELVDLMAENLLLVFPDKEYWECTSTEFIKYLTNDPDLREISRPYTSSPDTIGKRLSALFNIEGSRISKHSGPNNKGLIWRVDIRERERKSQKVPQAPKTN